MPLPALRGRAPAAVLCAAFMIVTGCRADPARELAEARRLQDTGHADQAMQRVDAVLAKQPALFDARLAKASLVGALPGREEEALGMLRQLAQAEPRRTGVHRAMGIILARSGKFGPAVNQFEKELQIVPDDTLTLTELGMYYLRTGQWEQAEDRLRRATSNGRGDARAYRNLAEVSFHNGKTEDGLAQQREALKLAPDDADLLVTHARALLAYGHAEEGTALLEDGAKRLNDAAIPAERARQARESLDYDGAVAAYKKALELDPKRATTFLELGKTYLLMGRRDEARAAFESGHDLSPSDPYPYFYLGTMDADDGHLDPAIDNLRKSLELDPINPKAHYALGQAFQRAGRRAEAQAEFALHAQMLERLRGSRVSGTSTLD
ncbi:MAG TPA: tetratricopeptide repeat protein [Verrucomicrobiae bacterium]|nr:tetratricopeptide repeat protein [Verrucomicrobiae bacterium]